LALGGCEGKGEEGEGEEGCERETHFDELG
jgi:hypothetical protein